MKKITFVILLVLIISAGITSYFLLFKKKKIVPAEHELPEQIEVKLPTGEIVKAFRLPQPTVKGTEPERVKLILEGVVKLDRDDTTNIEQLVIEIPTGEKYVPFNAPYVNTLRFEAMNKKVKIQGVTYGTTTFKNYPGIWIEDIIEIK